MITESVKFTPSYAAVIKGNLEMVIFLLDYGASLNLFDEDCDFIPLHRGASTGRLDIVELLIKNCADVNEQDSQGRTSLDWVGHLHKRNFEDSYEDEDEDGRDDDEDEASTLFDNVVEALLLLKGKPDLNTRNRELRAALHVAVINGCDDI
ncbi:serine/threonine-protein phosphatase 6 regulatory ankyrin repeat subunit A-like [Belonocnema kinseyi]|uniref:serine/threonine-protein phosphatase 6 regulatory ankyrin repeat subunit A-like n=1 Tax=Belonocnema kinseyi TaxID=2817044 RepID=UPI00143D7360|nr:serine/threonine-protein phosphatase 6 regulatory ankyrin repeat subunit A-like [Belonocnema kinseyi]